MREKLRLGALSMTMDDMYGLSRSAPELIALGRQTSTDMWRMYVRAVLNYGMELHTYMVPVRNQEPGNRKAYMSSVKCCTIVVM
jgi:hypothetical protein